MLAISGGLFVVELTLGGIRISSFDFFSDISAINVRFGLISSLNPIFQI